MRKALLLAAFAAAAAFAAGEALVRAAAPRIIAGERPLIFMSAPMLSDAAGALRYAPRQTVRYAVVVSGSVEYDVTFPTNNQGFVDHVDYPAPPGGVRGILFVGDSYCAGAEGGEPWVPRLRERSAAPLYNLGIPGAGVQHFEQAVAGAAGVFEIDRVVVVATTDDFARALWRPLATGGAVRFCPPLADDAACERMGPAFHLIERDAPREELLRRGAALLGRANEDPNPVKRWLKRSQLLLFLRLLPDWFAYQRSRHQSFDANVAALRGIRERNPRARVDFVHVPDKLEASAGRYSRDLEETVRTLGIDYLPALGACGMDASHYYPRDNHPNADGYRRLGDCVGRHLGLAP